MIVTLLVFGGCVALLLIWFHVTNPYARFTIFKAPYTTTVAKDGTIDYVQHYTLRVWHGRLANALGYIKSGFLIVQNTLFGGQRAAGADSESIIAFIHKRRFNPSLPYLISGDQFSVLYPRNLGVFYNRLLDPNTAHSGGDWENRQRLYLQSVLVAIDGLSASNVPRTTIVPMGPRSVALTQVHPGGTGSDQVYGVFYALSILLKQQRSRDGRYQQRTRTAVLRLLRERKGQLQHIYDCYVQAVYHPETNRVRHNLHLSSARDGVIRSSSFYDNVVMHETIRLARALGLRDSLQISLPRVRTAIENTYWNQAAGYYNDDLTHHQFSADWLIGYVCGFFDLGKPGDLRRAEQIVAYVEASGLAAPLPIRYQLHTAARKPLFVRWFVPNYGGNVIWSYWGAQYITLLVDLAAATGTPKYRTAAADYIARYEKCIVRDGGFAETFDDSGNFLRVGLYKSIRITGWVVQLEHAAERLRQLGRS